MSPILVSFIAKITQMEIPLIAVRESDPHQITRQFPMPLLPILCSPLKDTAPAMFPQTQLPQFRLVGSVSNFQTSFLFTLHGQKKSFRKEFKEQSEPAPPPRPVAPLPPQPAFPWAHSNTRLPLPSPFSHSGPRGEGGGQGFSALQRVSWLL